MMMTMMMISIILHSIAHHLTFWTDESTHVFHDADHANADSLAEIDLLAYI